MIRIVEDRRTEKSDGCWLWTGQIHPRGYGQLSYRENGKSKIVRVHRAAYAQEVGPIPNGLYVMHTCDQRNCVNPEHLRTGTHLENMADMRAKGRSHKRFVNVTHCLRGHLLDKVRKNCTGKRYCSKCKNILSKRYLAKKQEHLE